MDNEHADKLLIAMGKLTDAIERAIKLQPRFTHPSRLARRSIFRRADTGESGPAHG
jgi:hypothetical protein